MSGRVAVIGFGNSLRRDDGAGWQVAERIAADWSEHATILRGQQPLPEWAVPLSETELVYFVDASMECGDRARLQRLHPGRELDEAALGGHAFGAEHLLALTRLVYGRAPEAYMLLVPAQDLGFGEDLSPRTARATEVVIRYLEWRLREFYM